MCFRAFFLLLVSLTNVSCGGGGSENITNSPNLVNQQPVQPPIIAQEEPPQNPQPLTTECEQPLLPQFLGNQRFSISPIIANYYFEADGDESGVGNSGDNPDIVPEFIASEEVSSVGLNYVHSGLHGIPANNFYGTYEGEITVYDESITILANLSSARSHNYLYINDEYIAGGEKCSVSIPITLEAGVHNFSYEYHNHYFSAGFLLSFTDYPIIAAEEIQETLSTLVGDSSKIFVVSGYSTNEQNSIVKVSLPENVDSVILILNSYEPLFWELENLNNANVEAILINSYDRGSKIVNDIDTPIYYVENLSVRGEVNQTVEKIKSLTALSPFYVHTEHTIDDVIIDSATNMLDNKILGEEFFVKNNYKDFTFINANLEIIAIHSPSKENEQQLASFFELSTETVLTEIEWAGLVRANPLESFSPNLIRPNTHTFIVRVYSGDEKPEVLVDEIIIEVDSRDESEVGEDFVERFMYESDDIFTLEAGNYWLSIVEPESENYDFRWILDADEDDSGQGGAVFSNSFWLSTSSRFDMRDAPAGNMNIRGLEVITLGPVL